MLTSFNPPEVTAATPLSRPTRIDSHADYDLLFWSKRLGIPQEVLRGAIAQVGNDLRDVEQHLRQSVAQATQHPQHQGLGTGLGN
jgi:Protein of unknown function (DUF3606)